MPSSYSARMQPIGALASFNRACDRAFDTPRVAPKRALIWIAAVYGALWFAVTLCFPSMPFDSYEMFLFGREMQWGYWKHPPLEPWLTEIAYRITGGWIQSHFVLAIGSILVTFYFIWLLGRQIVGETGAALAVALTVLSYYFTHPVTMYSHNVGQLPFWAATVYFYRNAILSNRIFHWVALGIATALLLYSKYAGALLLVVLAGHLIATNEGRKRIFSVGPWLAASVALLLWLPNLIWLIRNDFLPFTFALDRPQVNGFFARALAALRFVFTQVGFHAGMIVIVLLAMVRRFPLQGEPVTLDLKRADSFDRSLVLSTALLPTLMIGALTFVQGVAQRDEIGGSLVALSGLALVLLLPQRFVVRAPRLVTILWVVALIGLPITEVAANYLKPRISGRVSTQMWPAQELSAAMQSIWKQHTSKPLDIVTGDFKQAGFVALYTEPRPSVFIDANFKKSAWITPQRLRNAGALVLWPLREYPRADELPAPYRETLQGMTPQFGAYDLKLGHGSNRVERYGWAVVLPP